MSQRYQLEKVVKCIIWIPGNSQGSSWSWSYGSWIYNFLCNQCLQPLTLWVRIPLSRGIFDKTCYKVTACRWYYSGTPFPPPIKLTAIAIWYLIPICITFYTEKTCTYPCQHPWVEFLGRLIFFVVIFHL